MSNSKQSFVLDINSWTPSAVRYMAPRCNDYGGKAISILSTQTGRSLHIKTPLMTTWGISDYVDQKTNQSDGKFNISLSFPQEGYANANTDAFLEKLKAFEDQILNDAVTNSELWWGEKLEKSILKHTFNPILKYSKDKTTKKIDLSKPPNFNAKVPFYEKEGKWNVEIYDVKSNKIFPCEDEELTPAHFVPKLSSTACVIQCGGIWIGGKGWGVTWKLVQCVVKPRESVSIFGKCQIQLSDEDKETIETRNLEDEYDMESIPAPEPLPKSKSNVAPAPAPAQTSVHVADTDDEKEEQEVAKPAPAPIAKKVVKAPAPAPAPVEEPVVPVEEPEPAPAQVEEPVQTPAPTPVKKVVKKVVAKK